MPKKNSIEVIITGILIVILFFLIIHLPKGQRGIRAPATPLVPAPEISDKDAFSLMEKEAGRWELKRDPFTGAHITKAQPTSAELSLSGIIWDKDNPMAIINNEVVKIADSVGKFKVVEIKVDRVVLNNGLEDKEIILPP